MTVLLFVSAAIVASNVLFFFYRDNFSTHYPVKVVSAALLRAGELPYWNFHDGGGQPLAGNPNTLTFYPDNVLYLFLPPHVAFNLHFLLHLAGGWLAMRALTRSRLAAWIWVLSGVVVSATAFYNLVTAVALVPFAMLAAERRSWPAAGLVFGLLALAGEPVTIVAAGLAAAIVGFRRFPARAVLPAMLLALVIAAPQLVAYSEVAAEVERARGFSAEKALQTSLTPLRIAEIFIWPFSGFLNDRDDVRLFSTLFLGIAALPALFARSRYTVVAIAMLFLATGRFNPLIAWAVETFPAVRIVRYPEKFAMPLIAALVVLIAGLLRRAEPRVRIAAGVLTLAPLVWCAWRALPVDRFDYYEQARMPARRVFRESAIAFTPRNAREEYRYRARTLTPVFGAVAGLRYAGNRSPEGMHSLLSAIVAERIAYAAPAPRLRHLQLLGTDVPGALPQAMVAGTTIPAASLRDAMVLIERGFDIEQAAVVPAAVGVVRSSPDARVVRYEERAQEIDVAVRGHGVLMVNQTYFSVWRAVSDGRDLRTFPINVDRLGVLLPGGETTVNLRFGRRRAFVAATWVLSTLAVAAAALALFVEKLHRRSREVERPGDQDARTA